jgi:hypothetical protein
MKDAEWHMVCYLPQQWLQLFCTSSTALSDEPSDMSSGLMSCCWHSLWQVIFQHVQPSLKHRNHLHTEIWQLSLSPLASMMVPWIYTTVLASCTQKLILTYLWNFSILFHWVLKINSTTEETLVLFVLSLGWLIAHTMTRLCPCLPYISTCV